MTRFWDGRTFGTDGVARLLDLLLPLATHVKILLKQGRRELVLHTTQSRHEHSPAESHEEHIQKRIVKEQRLQLSLHTWILKVNKLQQYLLRHHQ